MTYNVFGGTLNLTELQLQPRLGYLLICALEVLLPTQSLGLRLVWKWVISRSATRVTGFSAVIRASGAVNLPVNQRCRYVTLLTDCDWLTADKTHPQTYVDADKRRPLAVAQDQWISNDVSRLLALAELCYFKNGNENWNWNFVEVWLLTLCAFVQFQVVHSVLHHRCWIAIKLGLSYKTR